jgi:subtilisin family serine protease
MDSLSQIKLSSVMTLSSGSPTVTVGLIDGPIDFNHTAFQNSRIKTVKESQIGACKAADSVACVHGTFVAGILCAKRGLVAPAICPNCQIILYPIFSDNTPSHNNNVNTILSSSTPEELSQAIIETVDAGANVINLSLGLNTSFITTYCRLQEAYDYALKHHVIIITAAGNQGNIGYFSILNHPWVIPIAACDEYGHPDSLSNFGHSIGRRGLLAPGVNITSTRPSEGYIRMSGTSFAAPFVTGTVALLWSLFPNATVEDIMRSITSNHRRTIIPPVINAEAAWKFLKAIY